MTPDAGVIAVAVPVLAFTVPLLGAAFLVEHVIPALRRWWNAPAPRQSGKAWDR